METSQRPAARRPKRRRPLHVGSADGLGGYVEKELGPASPGPLSRLVDEVLEVLQRAKLHDFAGGLRLDRDLLAGEGVDARAGFGRGLLRHRDLGQSRDRECAP